jgi:hypothetical protein
MGMGNKFESKKAKIPYFLRLILDFIGRVHLSEERGRFIYLPDGRHFLRPPANPFAKLDHSLLVAGGTEVAALAGEG